LKAAFAKWPRESPETSAMTHVSGMPLSRGRSSRPLDARMGHKAQAFERAVAQRFLISFAYEGALGDVLGRMSRTRSGGSGPIGPVTARNADSGIGRDMALVRPERRTRVQHMHTGHVRTPYVGPAGLARREARPAGEDVWRGGGWDRTHQGSSQTQERFRLRRQRQSFTNANRFFTV
jgi:hypothetical protein